MRLNRWQADAVAALVGLSMLIGGLYAFCVGYTAMVTVTHGYDQYPPS